MKKNVASQKIGAQMIAAADGSAFTSSVTVEVTLDAGTQATGTVGSGACTHEGNGYHTYAPSQAETNGDLAAFTFHGTGAVPVTVQIYTLPTTGILAPTTAARTLDVSATGEAGVDWANVGSPTTTLALTGTTIATTQKVDVDTIKTNPVVNAGTITFPTTATLASTTNITAGTIATVTTLTNLPAITANWLTAAGTAADFGTEVFAAVWDGAISGHTTSGTTGAALNAAGSAGDPWSTPIPGAYGAGTAGKIVGDNITGNAYTRLGAPAGASVSADIAAVKAVDDAVKAKTDLIPASPASTTNITAGTITTVSNVTGLTASNLDTTVSSRASPTNITAASGVALTSAYDFAKGTVAVTESYNADGAAPTPVQALMMIMQMLTEATVASTTLTVKKLDGSTTAATFTLNSSTAPTSITRA